MKRWLSIAILAVGLAAGCARDARAGEADARKLVAEAAGKVLVLTWSPLNVMRIAFAPEGRMSVIGMGLKHCDGPHPATWRIDKGQLCLNTKWSTPCFAITREGQAYKAEESGRQVYARIDDPPLGKCGG